MCTSGSCARMAQRRTPEPHHVPRIPAFRAALPVALAAAVVDRAVVRVPRIPGDDRRRRADRRRHRQRQPQLAERHPQLHVDVLDPRHDRRDPADRAAAAAGCRPEDGRAVLQHAGQQRQLSVGPRARWRDRDARRVRRRCARHGDRLVHAMAGSEAHRSVHARAVRVGVRRADRSEPDFHRRFHVPACRHDATPAGRVPGRDGVAGRLPGGWRAAERYSVRHDRASGRSIRRAFYRASDALLVGN